MTSPKRSAAKRPSSGRAKAPAPKSASQRREQRFVTKIRRLYLAK